MAGQGRFGDDAAVPDGLDQFVAVDDAFAVCQQIGQQVEDLRRSRDRPGRARQFAPVKVEQTVVKRQPHSQLLVLGGVPFG
ncbi:Uncharacterised protein [Bordetella pertussis]|nr:Uncharacterised protein [Bordetella pertussis]